MTASADKLAQLLASSAEPVRFSAFRTLPVDSLQIEVQGLGPLELPVSEVQARRLCQLGRPARYGRGEQTLLDPAVRDTSEIPKSRVKIDKRTWNRSLLPVLERLGADLGLPPGGRFEPQLHSVLVYAPGQFFVQHQDSEKDDTMVASLVVTLPGTFSGGTLEVEHQGRTAAYRGSKKSVSLVAFYADCRHRITPVKSGRRVVLTYDLLLRQEGSSDGQVDSELVDQLASCLEQHFSEESSPRRLVFLLDHEYTRRGLAWSHLKGDDSRYGRYLRAASERAGCDARLGLADVHETWDAFEPEPRWRRYGRWRDDEWDDDDDDDFFDGVMAEDYELGDLIEAQVALDSWTDPSSGKVEEIGLVVPDEEVCAATASDDLSPYNSEYEGYMGNWGNTLDRWYHRGAVVLWPQRLAFAVRAELSPSWAIDALAARIRDGDRDAAQRAVATLAPFWDRIARPVEGKRVVAKALRVASGLEEAASARALLEPFRLETLSSIHAKPLRALVERYGEGWARDMVKAWSWERRGYYTPAAGPETWLGSLPALCRALEDAGGPGTVMATLMLTDSWRWLAERISVTLEVASPSRRHRILDDLAPAVAGVLQGSSQVGATDLNGEALALLHMSNEDLIRLATHVLRAVGPPLWEATGLDAIADHCRAALEEHLSRTPRAADDWSIELPQGCHCELCSRLQEFLADRSRRSFEWPLAKDRRQHVHQRISGSELPVTHETRRTGRPYTLVLTKTEELFQRDKQARSRDKEDLVWLKRSSFVPTRGS